MAAMAAALPALLAATLLGSAMRAFPYVFHPITVLGAGIVVLIYYEWNRQRAAGSELGKRLGAFAGSGVLSLLPTAAYMAVTGQGIAETTQGNAWQVDWLVGGGVLITAAAVWLLWRRFDWGPLLPDAMEALAAVVLPYLALSPFWNVSGHVIVALFPTLYLTLVDAKFWPLNVVPVVMVFNRVYLDAHTWEQSVGAFAIAAAVTVLVYRLQAGGRTPPASRSTVQ